MANVLKFDQSMLESQFSGRKPMKSIRTPSGDREAVQVPLNLIDPYQDTDGNGQPFQMYGAEEMEQMVESIREMGIFTPVLLRPWKGGRYQTLAGHNRIEAAKQAGLTTVPAVIRECSDEDAAIAVVDTNLRQRQRLLPSERARAYKVKMDAIGRKQGQRSDLTGEDRQDTAQAIADEASESKRNIFRYLRLNKLIPPLLQRVDEKAIGVEAGGSLSTLRQSEQERLEQILVDEGIKKVTPKQAAQMSQRSEERELSEYDIEVCLNLHKDTPLTLTIKLNVDGIISEDECKWMKKRFRQRGKDKLFVKCLIETLRKEINR